MQTWGRASGSFGSVSTVSRMRTPSCSITWDNVMSWSQYGRSDYSSSIFQFSHLLNLAGLPRPSLCLGVERRCCSIGLARFPLNQPKDCVTIICVCFIQLLSIDVLVGAFDMQGFLFCSPLHRLIQTSHPWSADICTPFSLSNPLKR